MAPLTLALAGQALIEHPLDPDGEPATSRLAALLSRCDVAFTNLEGTIAPPGGGTALRRSGPMHVAPPEVLDSLAAFGFDLLALASNHAADLGPEGVLATIDEVERRNIPHAGTGADAGAARRPALVERHGRRLALLALSASPVPAGAAALAPAHGSPGRAGVNNLHVAGDGGAARVDGAQQARLLAEIAELARTGAAVLVYVHQHYWIPDAATTPVWLVELAHACVEAGASVVACHGPPLLHGIERLRRAVVCYGLASFVFHTASPGRYPGADAWESVVAVAELDDANAVAALELFPVVHGHHPCLQPPARAVAPAGPVLASGDAAAGLLGRIASRSAERHGTRLRVEGGRAVLLG